MTRTDHVRFALSDWRFWMGIAYFGLVMVIVGLFVLFNRTAHEEAARAATAKSAGIAQVSQCFVAVRNAPLVDGFIRSHEAIIENGLLTNKASIAASPGDPLNPIRRRAIVRLTAAKANADELKRLTRATTPTRHSCVVLAGKLRVDPSRYTQPTK